MVERGDGAGFAFEAFVVFAAHHRGARPQLWREDRPLPSFDLVDLSSGKRAPVLQAEHLPLYLAQFSPDERWVLFLAAVSRPIYLAHAARAQHRLDIVRS